MRESVPLSKVELRRLQEGLAPWESMSFACGGWLQFYMFGVAKALQHKGLDKGCTYCGCSAGALTSAGLVLEGDFDDAVQFCKDKCVPEAYGGITGLFRLNEYVSECLAKYLLNKYEDIEPGILQIAVSKLPFFTTERVKEHKSKKHLMEALLASCAAFPFAPLVKLDNGRWYIDGGLSDFQPILNADTITVSPFYFSDCDIKPSRYVPLWWTFMPPTSSDTIDWLYALGWDDCITYVRSRGIPDTPKAGEVHSFIIQGKNTHEYDIPRRVSMHRFLGYDLGDITHQYISFSLDFILLLVFIICLKPLALALIYCELTVQIITASISLLLRVLYTFSPRNLVGSLYVAWVKRIYPRNIQNTLRLVRYYKSIAAKRSAMRSKLRHQIYECAVCFASFSLFLRWFSGRPSNATLRKHDRLAKVSVLYRVFRHII